MLVVSDRYCRKQTWMSDSNFEVTARMSPEEEEEIRNVRVHDVARPRMLGRYHVLEHLGDG